MRKGLHKIFDLLVTEEKGQEVFAGKLCTNFVFLFDVLLHEKVEGHCNASGTDDRGGTLSDPGTLPKD